MFMFSSYPPQQLCNRKYIIYNISNNTKKLVNLESIRVLPIKYKFIGKFLFHLLCFFGFSLLYVKLCLHLPAALLKAQYNVLCK